MSSKGRTDLKIWPSKAKNLEELDSDVRKTLAPRKSTENDEKRKKIWKFFRKKFFGVKKSKFANRLKRALPKFRGDRSQVRVVNGRSKFVAASAGRAERKQLQSKMTDMQTYILLSNELRGIDYQ